MPIIPSREFNKIYKHHFSEIFLPMGFKMNKNAFYRLCDGVVQVFNLRTYSYNNNCDFCFMLIPTSSAMHEFYLEDYGTSRLRSIPGFAHRWTREELLNTNFSEPIEITSKYIVPFFERGVDIKSACQTEMDIELALYKRIDSCNNYYWYFALQMKDYEMALRHKRAVYEFNKDSYEEKLNDDERSEEVKNRIRKERAELESSIQKLECRDPKYIASLEKMVAENEKKTMEFLESVAKKPRKPKKRTDE